eukprot:11346648-Alexandrium_andersonii.AAC.1
MSWFLHRGARVYGPLALHASLAFSSRALRPNNSPILSWLHVEEQRCARALSSALARSELHGASGELFASVACSCGVLRVRPRVVSCVFARCRRVSLLVGCARVCCVRARAFVVLRALRVGSRHSPALVVRERVVLHEACGLGILRNVPGGAFAHAGVRAPAKFRST